MPERERPGEGRAARLLLKAIRSLPEREQQTVLAYVLERSLEEPQGRRRGVFDRSFVEAGLVKDVGAAAGRLLRFGQGVSAVARLYRIPEEAVRAALHEVASDPEAPQPLAAILAEQADRRSHAQAARQLGISTAEVSKALEELPSSRLERRLGDALFAHARAAAHALHALAAPPAALASGALAPAGPQVEPVAPGPRPRIKEDPERLATRIGHLLVTGADVGRIAALYEMPEAVVADAIDDVAADRATAEPVAAVLRLLAAGRTRAQVAEELGVSEDEVGKRLEELLPSPLERRLSHALRTYVAVGSAGAPGSTWFGPAGSKPPGPRGAAQQMVPVRFPEPQYRRLKDWCGHHGFSMAVVVRGLVERFLDDQDRRAA